MPHHSERQSTSPHTHTHPALHQPTWRAQVIHKFVTTDTTGQPRFLGEPERVGTAQSLYCSKRRRGFFTPLLMGSRTSIPYLLLSAHLGALLAPPPLPPPARFLLPDPTVRSESCAYDTSVCCHGNRGGLRLERRALGSGPSAT